MTVLFEKPRIALNSRPWKPLNYIDDGFHIPRIKENLMNNDNEIKLKSQQEA